jgi:hypothetical protein
MNNIREDHAKRCYYIANTAIIKYTLSAEEINILKSCINLRGLQS